MSKGVKFLFDLHKIAGTAIALFFLMWFCTGLILIYHPYPRLSGELFNQKKQPLPSSLPSAAELQRRAGGEIRRLSVQQVQGQTVFSVTAGERTFRMNADSAQAVPQVTFASIRATALQWVDAPLLRVDTLHRRQQWVLYTRYDAELPLYKFSFGDPQRTQLFISGRSGEVQQLTTRSQRFWACIGAIPHKFYIPALRRDVKLWQNTIAAVSTVCLIAALSGWILGLYLWVRRYRRKRVWENPYKKRWYRWHFSFGLVFGIFLTGWAVSGIFSMQRIPQWLVRTEGEYVFSASRLWGRQNPPLEAYRLDYRTLKEAFPDLKEVEWTHFGSLPAYRIIEGSAERYIDASAPEVRPLEIPREIIEQGLKKIHGEDTPIEVSLLQEYDNYYTRRREDGLPAWKISVADSDRSLYYINPRTGYIRFLNKNKVVHKWLFNGIHYLDIDWLMARKTLWTGCIWILCAGCGIVCLSGVVLGVRVLRRSAKRKPARKPEKKN